jgi:hypothetical protein
VILLASHPIDLFSSLPAWLGRGNLSPPNLLDMSSKYAFHKGLKELRFLFCHTSSHSDATRSATQVLLVNSKFVLSMKDSVHLADS